MTVRELGLLILNNSDLNVEPNELFLSYVDSQVEQIYDAGRMLLLPNEFVGRIGEFFAGLDNPKEEYCFYPSFDPIVIAESMRQGRFFMSTELLGIDVPLIRDHLYKCIIPLNPDSKFHYHKSIRTAARKMPHMKLTIDRTFQDVIDGINNAYEDTWLADGLCDGYARINKANGTGVYPADVHSIELRDDDDNLLAGEIGFVTGESYVSLSGFHTINNSGSVQMAALGTLLLKLGFRIWDLGMQIRYKYDYGAIDCDRQAQEAVYGSLSDTPLRMPCELEYDIDELLGL